MRNNHFILNCMFMVGNLVVCVNPENLLIETEGNQHKIAWNDLADLLEELAQEYEPTDRFIHIE